MNVGGHARHGQPLFFVRLFKLPSMAELVYCHSLRHLRRVSQNETTRTAK